MNNKIIFFSSLEPKQKDSSDVKSGSSGFDVISQYVFQEPYRGDRRVVLKPGEAPPKGRLV